MTAFLTDGVGQVFHAEFLDRPFEVGQSGLGEQVHLGLVVHVVTGNQDVLFEEVERVFDTGLLLLRATRGGQNAAVDDRVAAGRGHLFKNHDVGTGLLGFNGSGQASKTRTDDDHVNGFVPLRSRGGGNHGARERGGTSGHGTGKHAATGNTIDHRKSLLFWSWRRVCSRMRTRKALHLRPFYDPLPFSSCAESIKEGFSYDQFPLRSFDILTFPSNFFQNVELSFGFFV